MSFANDLIARVNTQWAFFGKDEATGGDKKVNGKPKETVEPFASRVGDYWLTIPTSSYDALVKDFAKALGKLDGTVTALPWSAAFISYCMQMSGAGSQFPYSAGHATWIVKAIKNKAAGRLNAPLVGYRTNETPLQPGDLIGAPRQSGVTYNNAVSKGWFKSHTDIIVEVDHATKTAYAIGGNVTQSVARTKLKILSDGTLNDTSRPWLVVIRNNVTAQPPGPASSAVPHAG